MSASSHFAARLSWPGSARQLALVRIALSVHLMTVFSSPAVDWLAEVQPKPMVWARTAFPGWLEALITPALNAQLNLVGLGLVALLAVGLGTRLVAPAVFAVFLLTQNHWFRHSLVHDDWVYLVFELGVLAFARSGDAWSLDARLGWAKPAEDPRAYRWPIEWMLLWVGVVYAAAGLAKITPLDKGWLWLSGATAQDFAVWFSRESPWFWWLGETPFDYRATLWPWAVSAWATVVVEIGALALLFTRRLHLAVAVALAGMHLTIWTLGIPFFVMIFLSQVPLFLPAHRFGDAPRPPA